LPFQFGIGFAQGADAEQVARQAAIEAKTNMNADRIDLSLVFSTAQYDPKVFMPTLRTILGNTKLVGCSTAGLILNKGIFTHGIGVLSFRSNETTFGVGHVRHVPSDNLLMAGAELARDCLTDFKQAHRSLSLFFMDGHIENSSLLLKGIQSVLGNIFPIIGGGSCDDFQFKTTYQFFNNQVMNRAAVGVVMGGQLLNVGIGTRHGWRPLGKPRFVTKATGSTIETIDNKPAYSLYNEYFGKEARSVNAGQLGQMSILYPLGIFVEGNDEYLIRNSVNILKDGSIKCQGEVPTGAEIHVMIGNKESCKNAFIEAAQEARNNLVGKKAKLVIVIESLARLKLLGTSARQELNSLREIFGHSVPIFGFYSLGEISPFQTTENIKQPYIQNESVVILALA